MTTAPHPVPATPEPPSPPVQPFYGWRFVERVLPDGTLTVDEIPLTLDDWLHPQEGDQVVENEPHEHRRRYLANVLDAQLAGDPTAVVLSDIQIVWDIPTLRPHGPDIAVILNVRSREPRHHFNVAAEGTRPSLIIEVTSPDTAGVDRRTKPGHYARARVDQFVLVDAVRGQRFVTPRLRGYRLGPTGYIDDPPDARGRLWLPAARTWLGVENDEIVCYDEAGRPLGDYKAVKAALDQAETRLAAADTHLVAANARAQAEAEARAALEARLRAVEEELRRLRG